MSEWTPMTPDEISALDAKLAALRAERARLDRLWNCPHVVLCRDDCPEGTP
jgi:succinate dehydrogenase/fumarate reductase-like Fe-S protein